MSFFIPFPQFLLENRLITKGDIFHCAGGFQIENQDGSLHPYVKSVDGDVDSV